MVASLPSADAQAPGPRREETLQEVVGALAAMDRGAGSAGEREAARWLSARLAAAGADVAVQPARAPRAYAPIIRDLCLGASLGGALSLLGLRRTGAALAAGASLAIVDDVSNGRRLWRRLMARAHPTQNVVAEIGSPTAGRTLIVLAHHDAAPTGLVFDQRLHHALAERFPGLVERVDTGPPLWWPVPLGGALVAIGTAIGRRGLVAFGAVGQLVAAAAMADIARSPIVPGANDNATSCAVLVALAEALREQPPEDLRVLLVSCGAEEVLQGGIHDFAATWFDRLDAETTSVLALEALGSSRLILVEGEGPFRMRDYARSGFRDLVARCARDTGITMIRGLRSRASTDAVVPSRAGYATACVASMDGHRALSQYHLMSDTAENVDYATVERATRLVEVVARALDAEPR